MTKSTSGNRSAQNSGNPLTYIPDEGDIVYVELSPTVGSEKHGHRPAIVVTPRTYNGRVGRCYVCPITNSVRGYPFEVALPAGLKTTGAVHVDQGRAIDWRARGVRFVETAPQAVLDEVRERLAEFLGIP